MARENRQARHDRRFGKPERLADLALNSPMRKDWELPLFALDRPDPKHLELYWETVGEIREALATCPVIDGTNACRVYWDHPQDVWTHDDFPNVAPPFETFFIEAKHPGKITIKGGRVVEPAEWVPERWGFLFRAEETESEFPVNDENGSMAFKVLAGRKWGIRVDLIMARKSKAMFYPVVAFMPISADGKLMIWPTAMGGGRTTPKKREEISSLWACLLKPILFALSFVHCKNVVIDAVEPDIHVNRERCKHGLKPFVRYHTINIEPMKKVLRTEGQSETEGLKRALHICRGHFSTYSEEKPLFGKVAGTFWIPAHVRGEIKQGVVISDYKVNPSAPMQDKEANL